MQVLKRGVQGCGEGGVKQEVGAPPALPRTAAAGGKWVYQPQPQGWPATPRHAAVRHAARHKARRRGCRLPTTSRHPNEEQKLHQS